MKQFAYRVCGVSISRDIKNLSWAILGGPTWVGKFRQMTSRCPFQPQTFYESVNGLDFRNSCRSLKNIPNNPRDGTPPL